MYTFSSGASNGALGDPGTSAALAGNDRLGEAARSIVNRFSGRAGLDAQAIVEEFRNVLAVKEVYGPRLWDTPGVVGLQMGLSATGRPLLDVIVERPGDIPKVPKFLMGPGPMGRLVKVRGRAVGYKLRLPKKRLHNAQVKLDQFLYNLQGYRTAGITYRGGKKVGLAAVLINRKDGQYVPSEMDGFPVYIFYLG